jgi:hypothetical protein
MGGISRKPERVLKLELAGAKFAGKNVNSGELSGVKNPIK